MPIKSLVSKVFSALENESSERTEVPRSELFRERHLVDILCALRAVDSYEKEGFSRLLTQLVRSSRTNSRPGTNWTAVHSGETGSETIRSPELRNRLVWL